MNKADLKGIALRTVILFAPVLVISTMILTIFLSVYKKLDLNNIYESQQNILALQKQKTTNSFQGIFSDLIFLKNDSTVVQYLNDPYKNSYYATQLLLSFCRNKRIYDQVRLIDAEGREEIRINYNNGRPEIVPDDMLQDKSGRYYFRDTAPLPEDTIYISPLDLNIEIGEIEMPYKPAIRFAIPLFDYDGSFRGILVLNYLAEEILNSIRERGKLSYGSLSLLNGSSNWLIAENRADEFSFMFNGPRTSFGERYPEVWNQMYIREHGTYRNQSSGIFFYDTIRPVPTLSDNESGFIDISFANGLKFHPAGYQWKIVTHLSASFLEERYRNLSVLSYSFYGLVNISLLIASLIIAYVRTKQKAIEAQHIRLQQEHYLQMKEGNERLKEQVERTQELVHILCHDLVNPIGCVLGVMEILDSEEQYSSEYSKLIHSALDSAMDVVNLVRTMRALDEGKSVLELAPVNLREAVEHSLMLTRSKYEEKSIRIDTNISENLNVKAEKTSLINSVINNILTNAIKFSERGSFIDITAEEDEFITLIIKDRGRGIPADLQRNLFDSSKPTSRPGTEGEMGTGYGMPLVKKFMHRYNGDIKVKSKTISDDSDDHGTEISLIFEKATPLPDGYMEL